MVDEKKNSVEDVMAELVALPAEASHDDVFEAVRRLGEKARYLQAFDRSVVREKTISILKDRKFSSPAKLADSALIVESGDLEKAEAGGRYQKDIEPWPEPVDGNSLVLTVIALIERHVVMAAGAPLATALWLFHAHAHFTTLISAILCIGSPEKRCGKTTLLNVLGELAPRPLPAVNMTPATVYRLVDEFQPTLLIDEADTFLGASSELVGVLNSGHNIRGASVPRCVGDDHTVKSFSTFCPKVIASIGGLKGTLKDRSITVWMRRKLPTEKIERLRLDRTAEFEEVARKLCRWVNDHFDALKSADPEVPDCLNDRAADNWRHLIAIADVLGDEWGHAAREAAISLSYEPDEEDSSGEMLLSDIRLFFVESQYDRVRTGDLIQYLVSLEGRPWSEWKRGRPMNPLHLSRLLAKFKIKPKTVRFHNGNGGTAKGYDFSWFQDAFERYLPPMYVSTEDDTIGGCPVDSGITMTDAVTTSQGRETQGEPDSSGVTTAADVTALMALQPPSIQRCNGVTAPKHPSRAKEVDGILEVPAGSPTATEGDSDE
ncbi:MAG: DUF3631 domain-containing protein [Deltaproteobacteria bacterium]|nr:DUF3631 domain-containing protein [Deltaproteobacteria bacterium]